MTVAFYLPGGIPVFVFALLLGAGAALGLAWVSWRVPENQALFWIYRALWLGLAALLGSRLAYLGVNWAYFRANPQQILEYPLGGLTWPGAVFGGLLGLLMMKPFSSKSLGRLADGMLPLAVTLAIAAWLGCWLDGCAYGHPSQAWYAVPARDEWGILANRWPVQFIGALSSLLVFWLIERVAWPDQLQSAGMQASFLGISIGLIFFWLSLQRADPAPIWRGLRLESWSALGLVLLALISLLWLSIFTGRANPANR